MLVLVAALAAACGGKHEPEGQTLGPAFSLHRELPRPSRRNQPARLVVTIVDGDHGTRVRGAVVNLWHRYARTDLHGVAEIRVPGRRNLNVTVSAGGFSTRTVLESSTTRICAMFTSTS